MDLLPRALVRLACVACLIVTAGSARAADRVTVTGDEQGGTGRLEFVWPRSVDYDARVIFGRLVVRFSEPGDFDFTAYQDSMPQYLGSPKVVGNGTVIAFPLRVPVSVRHSQDGARIIIELEGEQDLPDLRTAASPEGEPDTAKPAEAPPPETDAGSAGGETLVLRVGEHPGFSRLVFDWPRKVAYRIEQRGRQVTIDFDARGRLDLTNYRRKPLSNVSDIAADSGEAGLSVTLSLPAPRLVRHFLDGSHVVVDVVHDEAKAKLDASVSVVALAPSPDWPAADAPEPEAAPVAPVTEGTGAAAPDEPAAAAVGQDGGPKRVASAPPEPPSTETAAAPPSEAAAPEPREPSPAAVAPALGGAGELTVAEVREVDHGDLAPAPGALVSARKPVLLRFDWPKL